MKYHYFVSYSWTGFAGGGHGNIHIESANEFSTIEHIRAVEQEIIRQGADINSAVVLNYQLLRVG